jgi:hypothetical protein
MRFYANDFDRLRLELEAAFDDLNNPKSPKRAFACATADLPPAADFKHCVVFDETAGVLKTSDGSSWV